MSTLSAFPFIGEQSFATPGAFNSPLSIISANIAAINTDVGAISGVTISPPSGNTIQMPSDLSISGYLSVGKGVSIGTQAPTIAEPVALTIGVNSGISDYLYFNDTSNLRSDYLVGSHAGGTADGLNIFDVSGNTMIVSFSKQSIRFYQNVVGPVFDVGGALASTLNAATFGTGADSVESRIQSAVNAAADGALARVYVPASMYPYSASSVSFIYSVQMVREGGDWSTYDVIAYGANSRGTGNSTAALQAAITGAGNDPLGFGQKVVIPQGAYVVTSGLTMAVDRVTVEGAGKSSSILYFIPPAAAACINIIKSGGTAIITRATVRGLGFQSAATNTQVKTAIKVHSGSEIVIEDIGFVTGTWVNGSIGFHLKGREAHLIRNVAPSCDRPVLISKSSYDAIDCDHYHFQDFYAIATVGSANTVIEIETGVNLTNVTFDGIQAWVGGQSGLWWNDSTSTQVSGNLALNNVRYEQSANTGGWAVYIAHNTNLQTLTLTNCLFGPLAQGVYLRKIPWVHFDGVSYAPSNNTAADFDATVREILITNCFWQTGSTASLTNLLERSRQNKAQGGSPLPDTGYLSDSVFPTTGLLVGDGNTSIPSLAFINDSTLGWCRSNSNTIAQSRGTLDLSLVYTSLATSRLTTGTTINPSLAFASETSLGWYRSAASTLALSYGTIDLTASGAMTSIASLKIKAGTNNSCGTAVLGSNGSVNVANTYVKTGDLIFLTDQTPGGTLGDLEVGGIRNSSGFTIQSTSITDTSTVGWLIIRPG